MPSSSAPSRCTGADVPLAITLVYSPRPREVRETALTVEEGCTVGQALQASGLLAELSAAELLDLSCGVWGRKVPPDRVVQANDRIELYRSLTVDPKVARRERFARQGAKKAAGLFAKRRVGAKAGY